MKRTLLTLALILSIFSISGITQQTNHQQWEYKFTKECDEKKANSMAVDGWELTEMSTASYGSIGVVTCVFKRAK